MLGYPYPHMMYAIQFYDHLIFFTDFFDIYHVEMFVYDYINFGQLSVKDCVSYKQCLNSLRTALVL